MYALFCRYSKKGEREMKTFLGVVLCVLCIGLIACNKNQSQEPLPKALFIKGVAIEGGANAKFVQDAILGVFLKSGFLISPTGMMIEGKYEELHRKGANLYDVPLQIRISATARNTDGTSVSAVAEVNGVDTLRDVEKDPQSGYTLTDMLQLAGKKLTWQIREQLREQEKYTGETKK